MNQFSSNGISKQVIIHFYNVWYKMKLILIIVILQEGMLCVEHFEWECEEKMCILVKGETVKHIAHMGGALAPLHISDFTHIVLVLLI